MSRRRAAPAVPDATRAIPERQREEDDGETRDDFERDADRVLYSSALRRLSGVTQVVSPNDSYVHHDRLTHSLKVAQVGMSLARSLGPRVSVEVVHTASLAHDLGHPPFGHAAEAELMAILDGRVVSAAQSEPLPRGRLRRPLLEDSFEGNAQTFRIVSRIAARKLDERNHGLNLTYRSLAAVLKYPWLRGREPRAYRTLHNHKWGAFASEAGDLQRALDVAAGAGVMGTYRSLEADIMDWADDVSYAVHDTEDFFRAGLIPLDVLKTNDDVWKDFVEYASDSIRNRRVRTWKFDMDTFDAVADAIRGRLPGRPYEGDFGSREELHLFGSDSIRVLLRDISVGLRGDLDISLDQRTRVEILKKLTRYYVIDRPDLLFAQRGQRRVVRELFFDLFELAVRAHFRPGRQHSLPRRFADYCTTALRGASVNDGYSTTDQRLRRATVDFICSLTDGQAIATWRQLRGERASGNSRIASL